MHYLAGLLALISTPVIAVAAPAGPGAPGTRSSSTNPSPFVLPGDFAGVRTTLYDTIYYAFGTRYTTNSTDDAEHNVPVAKSARFSMGWSRVDVDVLPNAGNWTASKPFVRGPAVHTFDNHHFVMYYSAISKQGHRCIGAATATTILGTYTPQAKPLICQSGTISTSPDPFVLNGKAYLAYKSGMLRDSSIQLQTMTDDGLSLTGGPTELLHETGNETDINVPAMTFNPSNNLQPILLFTAGTYNKTDFRIMYAVAPSKSLFPPHNETYIVNSTPLLQTGEINGVDIVGPGSPSFVNLIGSLHELTFVSDIGSQFDDGRSLRTANVSFTHDNKLSIV